MGFFKETTVLPVVLVVGAVLVNWGLSYHLNNASVFASGRSFGGPEGENLSVEGSVLPEPVFSNLPSSAGDSSAGVLSGDDILLGVAGPAGGGVSQSRADLTDKKLRSLAGYFALPAAGWNWGRLHEAGAVDIANACGTPIRAAAEGLVVEERSDGWNNGYGGYLKIEHPNGTATLYAHTQKNEAKEGNYVLKSDVIAYMGNTGNTHGPTGCHLHFEVHGAKNPFAK